MFTRYGVLYSVQCIPEKISSVCECRIAKDIESVAVLERAVEFDAEWVLQTRVHLLLAQHLRLLLLAQDQLLLAHFD